MKQTFNRGTNKGLSTPSRCEWCGDFTTGKTCSTTCAINLRKATTAINKIAGE